jgi:hypothetical protein
LDRSCIAPAKAVDVATLKLCLERLIPPKRLVGEAKVAINVANINLATCPRKIFTP